MKIQKSGLTKSLEYKHNCIDSSFGLIGLGTEVGINFDNIQNTYKIKNYLILGSANTNLVTLLKPAQKISYVLILL